MFLNYVSTNKNAADVTTAAFKSNNNTNILHISQCSV